MNKKLEEFRELFNKVPKIDYSIEFFKALQDCGWFLINSEISPWKYEDRHTSWDHSLCLILHDTLENFREYIWNLKKGKNPFDTYNQEKQIHLYSFYRMCKRYAEDKEFDWCWTLYLGSMSLGTYDRPIRLRKVVFENNEAHYCYTQLDLDSMQEKANYLAKNGGSWYKDRDKQIAEFIKTCKVYPESLYDEVYNEEVTSKIYNKDICGCF